MTEPLFNIEVFNQKTTQEKIDYLFNCTQVYPFWIMTSALFCKSIKEKSITENNSQYSQRIKEIKANSDLDKPEAANMIYMLELMRKYTLSEYGVNQVYIDHLIIKDYNAYIREIKLNKLGIN